MQNIEIEYRGDRSNKLGHRHLVLSWTDPNGEWRPELHPADGKPVGYRRSQGFFADPDFEKYLIKHLPIQPLDVLEFLGKSERERRNG